MGCDLHLPVDRGERTQLERIGWGPVDIHRDNRCDREKLMPTGYNSKVEDGTVTSLKDFALICANCQDMKVLPKRDMGYHTDALVRLNSELNKLQGLTIPEINRLQDTNIRDMEKRNKEYSDQKALYIKRYQGMMVKVLKWEPPTPEHKWLKDLMIQQLNDGIKESSVVYQWKVPAKLKPSQFIKEERARLFKEVEYHTNYIRDENEKQASTNSWIIELFRSLGLPEPKEAPNV